MPPEDELPGPPVSEEAEGGQSLLLADGLVLVLALLLPLALPLLGEADWLPGGQSAAALVPPALLLGELVVSDELVLGELVPGELVLGELVADELVLGEAAPDEPEYEPLDDCAIAPAERASRALAVAAASRLSFMRVTPSGKASIEMRGWDRAQASIAHPPFRASDVPATCGKLSRCGAQCSRRGSSSDASSACSWPRSAGFTRWWSNPASRARRRSCSWPQPVRATIAGGRSSACARMRRATS